MKEIFPGLYQLPLMLKGFSPASVNVYLLRDNNEFTIIDTGWGSPESIESLEAQLTEINVNIQAIKRVILTHFHLDHLGLMGKFKEWNRAIIGIHMNELELMKVRYNAGDTYWPMTDRFLKTNGAPDSMLIPANHPLATPVFLTNPDIVFKGGEELQVGEYCLRIINTPGHTPGHLSLYEPQKKFLISGDVLLPTIITNAAPHVKQMHNPIQLYLNSLRNLKEMDIDLVLPGHEYVFSGHRKRIDEIAEHYRQKTESAWQEIKSNTQPLTAYEVAQRIPYVVQNKTLSFDQLGGLNKRFALLQTIALLNELVESRGLKILERENLISYIL
jgi:glyoxylase-like metal-dependent hydrolase (beta-lactamase superfamily II)